MRSLKHALCQQTFWTALFIYVNYGDVQFYQSNCEGKLDYTLSPNVASRCLCSCILAEDQV